MKYDWHVTTRSDHQRRHDDYLSALSEQNRLRRAAEAAQVDQDNVKKKQLENGFSTYVNGAHSAKKRVESRAQSSHSRAQSRAASRATTHANDSPEKPRPLEAEKSFHRKSWVDSDVLKGDALPDFVSRARADQYSTDFDESEIEDEVMDQSAATLCSSSDSSIAEKVGHISLTKEHFTIPRLSPPTSALNRKKWHLSSQEAPFGIVSKSSSKSSAKSSSSSLSNNSDLDEKQNESAGHVLRKINRDRRQQKWLQESWNLIDTFEKNNKGRTLGELIENEDCQVQV